LKKHRPYEPCYYDPGHGAKSGTEEEDDENDDDDKGDNDKL
jgi:hypothetical protein